MRKLFQMTIMVLSELLTITIIGGAFAKIWDGWSSPLQQISLPQGCILCGFIVACVQIALTLQSWQKMW